MVSLPILGFCKFTCNFFFSFSVSLILSAFILLPLLVEPALNVYHLFHLLGYRTVMTMVVVVVTVALRDFLCARLSVESFVCIFSLIPLSFPVRQEQSLCLLYR